MATEITDLVIVDEKGTDFNAFLRLINTRQTLSKIIHVSTPYEAATLRKAAARINERLSQLPNYQTFMSEYLKIKDYDNAA